jgi:hypothetical protein
VGAVRIIMFIMDRRRGGLISMEESRRRTRHPELSDVWLFDPASRNNDKDMVVHPFLICYIVVLIIIDCYRQITYGC